MDEVKSWSTPRVTSGDYTYTDGDPEQPRLTLSGEAKKWQTPQAHDKHGARSPEDVARARAESGAGNSNLNEQVIEPANWPSPRVEDGQCAGPHPGRNNPDSVNSAVKQWSTPQRHDSKVSDDCLNERDGILPKDVKQWPSPIARDSKSGRVSQEVFDKNSRPLNEAVERQEASGQQLNPEWEEILMGWSIGWTDPTKPCAGVWPGFPMGQGAAQFDFEPPRTIPKGSMPGRTKRVEMCGNGVVPQCAAAAYAMLLCPEIELPALTPDGSETWHTPTVTDAWAGELALRKCKGWENGRGWTLGQQVLRVGQPKGNA